MPTLPPSPPRPDGALARGVRRAAGIAASRPKTAIALWLVLVIGCLVAGGMSGNRTLTDAESGAGESQQADERIAAAGLADPAVESILIRSADPAAGADAAADLGRRLQDDRADVAAVTGPDDAPELSTAGGRAVLVQARLRGDPDDAGERADAVGETIRAVQAGHPGVTFQQAGTGSFDSAIMEIVEDDLQRAELISLPITLIVLVLAFGALVAACVPLVLGVTAVAAAMGALGVVSQIAPTGDTTASVVVLIGLAVGVDYSLFYIRREREERRAGRGPAAALDAASATVGRAILVSGLTVMVALAGLLLSGNAVFISIGLATMLVVAIAVLGSLTVLPAMLALLGDRIDKGRLPRVLRRPRNSGAQAGGRPAIGSGSRHRRPDAEHRAQRQQAGGRPAIGSGSRRRRPNAEHRARHQGAWARIAGAVTRRPMAALVTSVCILGALAAPVVDLDTNDAGIDSLPAELPVVQAQRAIERDFPGAPSTAKLVVSGERLGAAQADLEALGHRAAAEVGGDAAIDVQVARDQRTAIVTVPMSAEGAEAQRDAVDALRDRVVPTAPGSETLVTGDAARSIDFAKQLSKATPIVIGFVLALAFGILLWAFGSPKLAAAVVGLNLLSVGAAFGVMVAVFQHTWAEDLLGFTSSGTIVSWLPLFSFVVLFGLSMDYTVLVLERVREARRAGRAPAAAAAEGIAATAGTVTSAAVVMVAIFAVFATLRLLDMKQMGVGLAVAVLLDVTLVRGVALPAAITLLGERGWKVPRPGVRKRPAPIKVPA